MAEADFSSPQSRAEKILAKTIQKYTGEVEEPQSRIEELLIALNSYILKLAEDSGGFPDWDISSTKTKGYIKNKPAVRSGRGTNSIIENAADGANGEGSHAEGFRCCTLAAYSHAEGSDSQTYSRYAHAEGQHTIAGGIACHVEGINTNAAGVSAHAEGDSTSASGSSSHAEGDGSKANGAYSHAEGESTVAEGEAQHVFGKYNIRDGRTAFVEIVGNGDSDDTRSNARTLDWKGNETVAGKISVGKAPEEEMDVTTKKYVDDLIADLQKKIDALTPSTT